MGSPGSLNMYTNGILENKYMQGVIVLGPLETIKVILFTDDLVLLDKVNEWAALSGLKLGIKNV